MRILARHIGLWVALLALGGCGSGDGELGGSKVPNLSLTASATGTTAGGQSVYLTAISDTAGVIDWALSGPGRLDAASGGAVSYWPPSASDLTEDEIATVSAYIGSASASTDITVAGSSTLQWERIRLDGANIHKAAYGDGKFVLLDQSGSIYTGDGRNWSRSEAPDMGQATAVAFGNGRFVLVGYTFLSGKVCSSAYGIHWQESTPMPTGAIPPLRTLIFSDGRFTAAGQDGVTLISTDGISWTNVTVPKAATEPRYDPSWPGSNTLITLGGANGRLMAGGMMIPPYTHGLGLPGAPWRMNVFTSPDAGRTWMYVTPDASKPCYPSGPLAAGGTRIVAAGYCDGSTLATGTDGANWSPPASVGRQAQPLLSCTGTVTGQTNPNVSALAWGGGRFAAVACGRLLSSVNGTDWGIADGGIPDRGTMKLKDIIFAGSRFVAVGGQDILISK